MADDDDGDMSDPKDWLRGGPLPPDPNKGRYHGANNGKGNGRDNVHHLNGSRHNGSGKRNRDDEPPWCKEWHLSDSDTPLVNLHNVMLTLRHHPELVSVIRFNDWDKSIWLTAQVPDTECDLSIPRPMRETDVLAIQEKIQRLGLRRVSQDTVYDALTLRAQEQRFNPVTDYLNGLAWDGVSRLDTWLIKYMGAADTPYTRAIGKMFLIALAARALTPGCQADYMLILEGPQGIMKSSACRVLAGKWYSDSLPDLSRGDQIRIQQHLRGTWLIEIAEMSSFNAAEAHRLKEFITRPEEKYLPKFARVEVIEPRSCLFVGTTNESVYLKDTTGNRRFWPVAVTKILIDALAADRDQLLAEAVALHRAGVKHYPERDFEAEHIAPEQAARQEEDAWQPIIAQWLEGGQRYDAYGHIENRVRVDSCTIGDVAKGALDIADGNISRAVQFRISGIFTTLGWQKGRDKHGTVFKRPKK